MYWEYKTINYTIDNSVAIVELNRPEVSNAFDTLTYREVRNVFETASNDPNVRAIILTGKGKNFSAGGDIHSMKKSIENQTYIEEETVTLTGEMAMAIKKCSKPTIAMINGAAAGAGAGCVLACDFRIMAENSRLIFAFINLGLTGDTCSYYSLSRQIGTAKATELMLLGAPIGARDCEKLGLTYKVVSPECLESETHRFATRLANGPTAAYAMQKAALNEVFYYDMEKWINGEAKGMSRASRSEDFTIAVNAFLKKEKPRFSGR